jgi:quercetin dioxygenase-like cupin family protein
MVKRFITILLSIAQFGLSQQGQAPGARKSGSIKFENDNLRIVSFKMNPHESVGRHNVHPQATVFLTDSSARWTSADGSTREYHAKAGQTRWTDGGDFAVQLLNDHSAEMIAVQLKAGLPMAAIGWPVIQRSKPGGVEFENNRLRILRFVIAPYGKAAVPGFAPSVAVPLTLSEVRFIFPDSRSEERILTVGDFVWKPGGVVEIENRGGQRMEIILIQLVPERQGSIE